MAVVKQTMMTIDCVIIDCNCCVNSG